MVVGLVTPDGQRAKGAVSHDEHTTVEFIRDNLKDITNFDSDTENPKSTTESSMAILSAVGGDDDDDDDEEEDEGDEEEEEEVKKKTIQFGDSTIEMSFCTILLLVPLQTIALCL